MATNVISENANSQRINALELEALEINPVPRYYLGVNFLQIIQSEPLSELAISALTAYQEVFSEKPWEEEELMGKPLNLAKPIIIERLKRQLSNPRSIMVLLINPHNPNEVIGFANTQMLSLTEGLVDTEVAMVNYFDQNKVQSILRHQLDNTPKKSNSNDVFIVEEFGIRKKFRGGPKMLIKLTNCLTQAMRILNPTGQINEGIMWTSDNSKMNALAQSTGMKEVLETSGFRKGKRVRLVCYQFSVSQIEKLSQGYPQFIVGLLKLSLSENAKGNPEPLKRFLAQLTGKEIKKINHES